MIISHNTTFLTPETASIPLLSESFMYGHGVFETFRTHSQKTLFRPEKHISRLKNAARRINLPLTLTPEEIFEMLKKVVTASPHELQKIKIIAIREGIFIISQKLELSPHHKSGVSCKSIHMQRALPELKSLAYLPSYLAQKEAEDEGHFEAILTDTQDQVLEGARTNIFWFEDISLCTPKHNILPGITRETIMEISPFPLTFTTTTLAGLLTKDEIFLTNSVQGIVPVTEINRTKIGTGIPGKKTQKLIQMLADTYASADSERRHTPPHPQRQSPQ